MSKKGQNKQLKITILVLSIIAILVLVSGLAYARFISVMESQASAQIANMICKMDVKSSSEDENGNLIEPVDKSIINPYCIVTVRNYEGEENNPSKVAETGINFTINIKPKEGANGDNSFELPEYYWYEIESPNSETGTKIATSTSLNSSLTNGGDFEHSTPDTKYFKVVFLNNGEQNVTRYIDFDLVANQK